MSVRDISNTSVEDLAQIAADILDEEEDITLKCNRARSTVFIPKNPNSCLVITPSLKEKLMSHVTPKYEKEAEYVFYDRKGIPCCISLEVIEKARRIICQKYPRCEFFLVPSYAIVEEKTDIELMPADTADEYGIEPGDDEPLDYPFTKKESERMYILLKNDE